MPRSMLSKETCPGMTSEQLFPREGRDSDWGGKAALGKRPGQSLTVTGSALSARSQPWHLQHLLQTTTKASTSITEQT